MDEYKVTDVFTPTKPARYTFVERESINEQLVAALRTPGKQIVVYGYSGSGKTTLLENKLYQLYEDHITSRCVTGLSFEQLVLDAFDQLGSFYGAETIEKKKRTLTSAIKTEYFGIKAQVETDLQTTRQLILPPQLTPQTLARFLGEARCCWVLEDFHKMLPEEKAKLAQAMKIFMDMSDRYNDLKIIAIGAVDTAREVVAYDAEMRNRVSEIYVPLMKDYEIKQITEKGEVYLNIRFAGGVKDDVVKSSNGLASVCHQLCLNMCFTSNISLTLKSTAVLKNSVFQKAVEQYLAEASDTLKGAFDKAFKQDRKLKFDDSKLIVEALLQVDQEGANRATIFEKIKTVEAEYPLQRLTVSLQRLQKEDRGMILRHEPASGRYSFKDPFYRAFALAHARKDREETDDFQFGKTIFLSSNFDNLVFRFLKDYEPIGQTRTEEKKLPKMNWKSPVFTQKRKFTRQKH